LKSKSATRDMITKKPMSQQNSIGEQESIPYSSLIKSTNIHFALTQILDKHLTFTTHTFTTQHLALIWPQSCVL